MFASTSTTRTAAMRSISRTSSSCLRTATATAPASTSTSTLRTLTSSSSVRHASTTLTPPARRIAIPSSLTSATTLRYFSSSSARHNEGVKTMTSGEEEIYTLLVQRFSPKEIQVQDVSGGCGSFYSIVIASNEFNGLKTVKQHMLVNQCLKDVISGIHGLQLKTIPVD